MKARSQYIYTPGSSRHGYDMHTWTTITAGGALHLHITDYGANWQDKEYFSERFSGGVEVHYRTPPEYMKDDAPSQDKCWLLKCPCWHDGSSNWAMEIWVAMFDVDRPLSLLPFFEAEAIKVFSTERIDQ